MKPNISLPPIPAKFDPALKDYLTALTKIFTTKQLDDYSNSGNLNTKISDIGDGIIESGSNSNGSWVKFGDGTLISWGVKTFLTITTVLNLNIGTYGCSLYTENVTVNLPIDFVDVNYSASILALNTGGFSKIVRTDKSSFSLTCYSVSNQSNVPYVFIVIGKWK